MVYKSFCEVVVTIDGVLSELMLRNYRKKIKDIGTVERIDDGNIIIDFKNAEGLLVVTILLNILPMKHSIIGLKLRPYIFMILSGIFLFI